MKCPLCGTELSAGGIVAGGVSVMWVPEKEFTKKGISSIILTGGKRIGKSSVLSGQTRIPDAYYCEKCNKIIGVFDIDL